MADRIDLLNETKVCTAALLWELINEDDNTELTQDTIQEYITTAKYAEMYLEDDNTDKNTSQDYLFLVDDATEIGIPTQQLCQIIISKAKQYEDLVKAMRRGRQKLERLIISTPDDQLSAIDVEEIIQANMESLLARYVNY